LTVKKIGFALAAAAVLVVPSAALGAPTKEDTKAASAECHVAYEGVKKSMNITIGADTYTNFGDCVSTRAREEAAERRAARKAALEACEGLKGKERRDCVRSEKAEVKAKKDAKDQERLEAANTCATQKADDADAFAETYGTGRNGFGKCVSETAKAKNDDE
jgi:hypothetical protein